MKRIVNYFLMLLVLISITACKMEIDQNKSIDNNEVSFNFRAGEEVIGSTITIEITNGNILLARETKEIENLNPVNFLIKGLPLDENVVIKVWIKKEGVLQYKAEEKHTIKGEVTKVIIKDFTQFGDVIVLPNLSNDVLENYRGCSFQVTYNGKTTTKPIGDLPAAPDPSGPSEVVPPASTFKDTPINDISIYIDNMEINKPFNISAKIVDEYTGDIYFEYDDSFTPTTDGINKIDMNPNYGYFYYGSNPEKQILAIQRDYSNPRTSLALDNRISDFPIDFVYTDNGDLLYLDESYNIFNYPHGPKLPEQLPITNLSNIGATLSCISAYKDTVYVGGKTSEPTGPTEAFLASFSKSNNTENRPIINYSQSLKDTGIKEISEMVISGNTIYIAVNSEESPFVGGFKIYKGTIGGDSITDVTLFTESKNKSELQPYNFMISDMQFVDNTLYALAIDKTLGPEVSTRHNQNSRGALLKISSNSSMEIIGLTTYKKDSVGQTLQNIMIMENNSEELQNNFVGPRKFIAIKPKKLVISDAGAVWVSNDKLDYKKRVTTFDLASKLMDHIDIPASIFEGTVDGSSNIFTYSVN